MDTPSHRYSGPAIALHWLMALMIVGSFCMGLYMTSRG
jgi:cytochrome b561